MPPEVVIVGPPASGKSTIGSALADTLHVDFWDTDIVVESEAQMSIGDIFLLLGEGEFRKLENQVATAGLTRDGGVLALGSGAIESRSLRALLMDQFVVHLRLGAAEAAKRAGIAGARPVQLGNVRSRWNKAMARREPMYAEAADMVVDTRSSSPGACVAEIAEELSRRRLQNLRRDDQVDEVRDLESGGGRSD